MGADNTKRKTPVGIELYSVRNALEQDFLGTLHRMKAMGYDGVEFAMDLTRPPQEIRAALAAFGLALISWHTPWEYFLENMLEQTIAYNLEVGNRYIVCPRPPEQLCSDIAGWEKVAATLSHAAEAFAPHGLTAGYHNHDMEFIPVEGILPWKLLYDNTPQSLMMQLDMGNALSSRRMTAQEVARLLQRYPGRTQVLHLKAYSLKHGFLPAVGDETDDVPWQETLENALGYGGTESFIVEYACEEGYAPMEGCLRSIEHLRAMEQRGWF